MEILREYFKMMDIEYDEDMIRKFQEYMDGVLEYNEHVNLTAITNLREFIVKHYIDSVDIYKLEEYGNATRVIDVGTGGGFPGVPLAILSPDKEFIVLDSLAKRLRIIDELCEKIGISNVSTIHGRAEDIGINKEYRERFDLCVSRAVANLAVLAELCLPLVKPGGYFIAYKTIENIQEIKKAEKAITILGGEIVDTVDSSTPALEHIFVIIKKKKRTPLKYPRKAGTPAKKPIR